MKFRECGELLLGRRFSLKMKGMVYRSCVRSAMLYGSETWCLRENEKIILRRTERALVRSTCEAKLVDRKNSEDLMKMLDLKETLDKMAQANGVRWYGHVIKRDEESILKKAMMPLSEWTTKAKMAKADLGETSRREFEEDWVESGGGYRSCEMEWERLLKEWGASGHLRTRGKTGLKLDDDD